MAKWSATTFLRELRDLKTALKLGPDTAIDELEVILKDKVVEESIARSERKPQPKLVPKEK